jgi:hypothetical protein
LGTPRHSVFILIPGGNLLNSPLSKIDSANGFPLLKKFSRNSPASQFGCWISMVFYPIEPSKSLWMLQDSSRPRFADAHAASGKMTSSSHGRLQVTIIWDQYVLVELANQTSGWTVSLLLLHLATNLTANISHWTKTNLLSRRDNGELIISHKAAGSVRWR